LLRGRELETLEEVMNNKLREEERITGSMDLAVIRL